MNCIHCNAPDAHPGTRKCTDLQACHGRQEYARGVKAALDELRDAVKLDRQRCGDDMAESLWKSELLILAHIDGEPARIAAACEEVREACALRLANENIVKLAQASTEAQASAAEGVRYWTDLAQAEARDAAALRARVAELEAAANTAGADASAAALRAMARATKAEAERDEAQRGEQEAWRQTDQMRAERDALRAQVEAARTYARQALDYGEDCDATDLLAAMDEAKP